MSIVDEINNVITGPRCSMYATFQYTSFVSKTTTSWRLGISFAGTNESIHMYQNPITLGIERNTVVMPNSWENDITQDVLDNCEDIFIFYYEILSRIVFIRPCSLMWRQAGNFGIVLVSAQSNNEPPTKCMSIVIASSHICVALRHNSHLIFSWTGTNLQERHLLGNVLLLCCIW